MHLILSHKTWRGSLRYLRKTLVLMQCEHQIFFFFNSFNTINMGEGESCLHDCLHLQSPHWKKKKKSISRVFVQLWLLRPMAGGGRGGPCVKQNARVCVGHLRMCFLGGWYHWRPAICESMGWLGVQSRARSGWVFSFSPFSSCFRVPASTTDWDLIIGEAERYNYRQFMVATILESWRTFRFYVPLINQNTQRTI